MTLACGLERTWHRKLKAVFARAGIAALATLGASFLMLSLQMRCSNLCDACVRRRSADTYNMRLAGEADASID